MQVATSSLVLPFRELDLASLPQVGGENASLGEMPRVRIEDHYAERAGGAVVVDARIRLASRTQSTRR